jgi:hypothetical protein
LANSRIKRASTFTVKVVKYTRDQLILFVKGFLNHFETVGILVLASLGLNILLGELPFYVTLPLWIESTMLIPILSVFGILLIIWVSQHRPHFDMTVV